MSYYRPKGFGGFSFFPPVLKNLLIINGIVFLFQIFFENIMIGGVPGSYILNKWFALNPLGVGANFQIWQLITYQFMHGGFGHIFFNMFALWMFGMEIENLWGSKKFLFYYLLCGVAAGISQLFLPPLLGAAPGLTIGASGAIYGVLIAFGLLFPDRYIYLYFLLPIKAKYLIGFLIALEFLLVNSAGSNIAHLAHLGGALAGFLFIMFDSSIDAPIKRSFGRRSSHSSGTGFTNPFSGIGEKIKKRYGNIENAKYYDIDDKKENKDEDKITQAEIDKILDKISESGYQNLTEREKKILFEASKKMN
ncbi:rhomboid family intramembrane serine protease [bacterium BMS3Abin03]|nr:rhomboid family intramembrane serine protease [bacterium BMS3Abin03]MCG6961400.1 rhomboid family intramembrane serine protease [bacterium BMS3Abin03]